MTGAYLVNTRPAGRSVASFDAQAADTLYEEARATIQARHLPV